MSRTIALVVAAGRGTRFGGERPKQYQALAGRPILRYSLEGFSTHPAVSGVRAVIDPDDRDLYDEAALGLDLLEPVAGGDSRQGSVLCGLESLAGDPPDRVLIHDGARPFIEPALLGRITSALGDSPGAIAALPITDSVKRGQGTEIAGEVPREGLWRAQTPQAFHYGAILAAHREAARNPTDGARHTDDASVARAAGLAVALVPGEPSNIKITDRDDMAMAENWLALKAGRHLEETRVGTGFDVHRFGPGDHVILGGLRIAHNHGLSGHSDADVALHAITDALLGAIGAGDIGQHFPPSDPRWAEADSGRFVAHAVQLLGEAGGRILHIDLTLICQAPKIGPHRTAIANRIAALCGLDAGRVSVKATTTEGLGFTGRGEGIAAQAAATVALPPVQAV